MPAPHTATTPMEALLAKVDAVLRATGSDPATVSTDDKIMLAVQYIEVGHILHILNTHAADEVYRL
jgi:hypothetical protein